MQALIESFRRTGDPYCPRLRAGWVESPRPDDSDRRWLSTDRLNAMVLTNFPLEGCFASASSLSFASTTGSSLTTTAADGSTFGGPSSGQRRTPVVSPPKTSAGVRDVAIPPHVIPMLRAHVALYAIPGPDGLVFPNTVGKHMHHGSLYKVFKRARSAIGRPDLRFHDLRHTGATMAAQAGATMRELMDRLGHSTPQAALIYQHAAADRQAALAARLSEMASSTHKQPI